MKEIALQIIEKAFAGKVDKSGEPYVQHCKMVAAMCENANTEVHDDVVIIALLHDLLEDCPEWNEKSLRCFFNDRIVDRVVILTRKVDESYSEYIDRVSKDTWASIVKKYDLIHNMNITRLHTLTEKDLERLKKYHAAFQIINSTYAEKY